MLFPCTLINVLTEEAVTAEKESLATAAGKAARSVLTRLVAAAVVTQ